MVMVDQKQDEITRLEEENAELSLQNHLLYKELAFYRAGGHPGLWKYFDDPPTPLEVHAPISKIELPCVGEVKISNDPIWDKINVVARTHGPDSLSWYGSFMYLRFGDVPLHAYRPFLARLLEQVRNEVLNGHVPLKYEDI